MRNAPRQASVSVKCSTNENGVGINGPFKKGENLQLE